MKTYYKKDFPVSNVRRFLEPGPIVLVSLSVERQSQHHDDGLAHDHGVSAIARRLLHLNGKSQLRDGSQEQGMRDQHSDRRYRGQGGIGNTTGGKIDKFKKFELTAAPATKVKAPLITECFASFECRLADANLIDKYSLFVLEVVKAHVAKAPKYPRTVHYRGDGAFMIAGTNTSRIASSSGRRCCSVKPPCACAASAARGACFSSCCRQRLDARDP